MSKRPVSLATVHTKSRSRVNAKLRPQTFGNGSKYATDNVTVSLSAQNFIDVNLFGQKVTSLVDTGSTACLVNLSLFRRFPQLLNRIDNCQTTEIVAANNQSLGVLGRVHFFVKIRNMPYYLDALVCKDLCYELILGADFLQKYKSSVDLHKRTVSFAKPKHAVLARSITMPARAEKVCAVKVFGPNLQEIPGCIEPNTLLLGRGVAASRTLVTRRQKQAPIKLLNYTDKTITVPRGSVVGHFHTLPTVGPAVQCGKVAAVANKLQEKSKHENHLEYIQDSLDFSNSTLLPSDQKKLQSLIKDYSDVFASPHQPIGKCDVIKHTIQMTPEAKLPRSRPYRVHPHLRDELQKHIKRMLDEGLIEHSESPISSPVVLLQKGFDTQGRSKGTRFCIDYRRLNKYIIDAPEPCPSLWEIFDQLAADTDSSSQNLVFSTLDLDQGFHQLVLDEKSRPFTTFTTALGNYSFNRVPMGLKTSPFMFIRTMNRILHAPNDDLDLFKHVNVYIDDILVTSSGPEQHLEHLKALFEKFRAVGLQLSPRKCIFGRKKIKFLGMILTQQGIAPDPDKVKGIKEAPRPNNLKMLRRFLGATNWFRRYIKDYGIIAKPLYELTRKNSPFEWTQIHESAYERLKSILSEDLILSYPEWDKEMYVFSDASGTGIGGGIFQKFENGFRPLGYCGRALTAVEKGLSISLQEALAAVYTIKQFETYLKYKKFVLVTDHAALKFLFTDVEPKGKYLRWTMYLNGFNFTVQHRRSK